MGKCAPVDVFETKKIRRIYVLRCESSRKSQEHVFFGKCYNFHIDRLRFGFFGGKATTGEISWPIY